jgi:hypothetical protein
MYIGEPHSVEAITPSWINLAKPKSADNKTSNFVMSKCKVIYLLYFWDMKCHSDKHYSLPIFSRISCGCGQDFPPLWLSKIFCGFKSRWTIPFACNAFIAPAAKKIKNISHTPLYDNRTCAYNRPQNKYTPYPTDREKA